MVCCLLLGWWFGVCVAIVGLCLTAVLVRWVWFDAGLWLLVWGIVWFNDLVDLFWVVWLVGLLFIDLLDVGWVE